MHIAKPRYALWLYHNLTRAFFTTAALDDDEAAAVRKAGEDKAAELDASYECHFKQLDVAIADFAAETEEQGMTHLYEGGVGEQALLDFFGALGQSGENVGAAELISTISSLRLGPDGKGLVAVYPGAMTMRVGNGVAVLATAIIQHLDYCEARMRAGQDDTDPAQLARLRRMAEDLHGSAGGTEPDGPQALEVMPPALNATVKRWLSHIEPRDEIVQQVEER